ncbi:glutamyl-tRNA reductase [Sarracenia purpurea var. burkii]
MAVSSAFAGAKLETLLLSNSPAAAAVSSSAVALSPSQTRIICKPTRTRRALIPRGGLTIRCDGASDVLTQTADKADPNSVSGSSSPSLSALELLKTSAADSASIFIALFFFHAYRFEY